MREHDGCIDTPVVHHPQGLQVILESVPDDDRIGTDEGVERLAHGREGQERVLVRFRRDARKAGVEVAGGT